MIGIQVIDSEPECEKLWKAFCTQTDFWNLWEVRKCFHGPQHKFHFMKHIDAGRVVGLLPLVFDEEWKCYTYFGGFYPENNRLMLLDKKYAREMIDHLPHETVIYCLDKDDAKIDASLQRSEKHYFLDLKKYPSFEDFCSTFSRKHRKNLIYDLKNIESLKPQLIQNQPDSFEHLTKFNQRRFGQDSDYHNPTVLGEMKNLFDFAKRKGILDMVSVLVEEKVIGVAFGIVHEDVYYSINTGRDTTIRNLGKFLISEQIRSAIKKKCSKIDFLTGDDPWKDLWNLEWEDAYELIV